MILPPSTKICLIFSFPSVLRNLSHFILTIFGSEPHIPSTHSYSHFIMKLIYKSRTHNPLIFSTHFSLKPMPKVGQILVDGGSK